MDIERSVGFGKMTYWKPFKRGYGDLTEAGLYTEAAAKEIVESDFDKRTVMIHEDVVKRVLDNL